MSVRLLDSSDPRTAIVSRWRQGWALAMHGAEMRDAAVREATKLGLILPARPLPVSPRPNTPTRGRPPVTCRRAGREWELSMGQRRVSVADRRGLSYLAILCANPGREIRAADLASGLSDSVLAVTESNQSVLDDIARREYRQRLSLLEQQLDEYIVQGDAERATKARAERDWLVDELMSATGLNGRVRTFSNQEERARISVGKAIRRAIAHIEAADPAIGEALRDHVQTGLRCCYWQTSGETDY